MKKRLLIILCACLVVAVGVVSFFVSNKTEAPPVKTTSPLINEVHDKSSALIQDVLEKERLAHEAELKKPFWAVIAGGDTRKNTIEGEAAEYGTYGLGYSDTMMLLYVRPDEGKITLVTIPRDTRAERDGKKLKVNEFLLRDGIDGAVEQVEKMAGIDIKYYFATDFARFVAAIDFLGGIDVISPIDMHYTGTVYAKTPYDLTAGENHLDGEGALGFARARKVYASDVEACRQIQDRQIIQRIIEAGSAASDETRASYLEAIHSFVETNIPEEDLEFYAGLFAEKSNALSFLSGSMPYVGYVMEDTQQWTVPYEESIWQEMVRTVEAGGDPNSVVPAPYVAAK